MVPTAVLGLSASGIAGTDGTVTLTFQAPPPSTVYTGTVNVQGSTPGAQWKATVMGLQWGSWSGTSSYGPIQAFSGMAVQIIGAGLPPGTIVQANFTGQASDEQNTQVLFPNGQGNPPNEVMLLPATTFVVNGTLDTLINIPANADVHALGIVTNSYVGSQVLGIKFSIRGTSNYLYYEGRPLANVVGSPPRNAPAPYIPSLFIVPYTAILDPAFLLGLVSTGGSGTVNVGITGYTAAIPPYIPSTIPSSSAQGTNASATVPTTILPAMSDGRSYLIQSITLSVSGATVFAYVAAVGDPAANAILGTVAGQGIVSATFGAGLIKPSLAVLSGSNTVNASADVTYQMI